MIWHISHRADRDAVLIADRHYNRQKIGSPQFVPPGRCVVLKTGTSVWVTSWPFAEYVKHAWGGLWVNSLFRREGGEMLASDMIREAIAATRFVWQAPPGGIVTFVNRDKVKHKRDPGRCYLRAGFHYDGETKGGLIALVMPVVDMPDPSPAIGMACDVQLNFSVGHDE